MRWFSLIVVAVACVLFTYFAAMLSGSKTGHWVRADWEARDMDTLDRVVSDIRI